jgi:hypothetical protein
MDIGEDVDEEPRPASRGLWPFHASHEPRRGSLLSPPSFQMGNSRWIRDWLVVRPVEKLVLHYAAFVRSNYPCGGFLAGFVGLSDQRPLSVTNILG